MARGRFRKSIRVRISEGPSKLIQMTGGLLERQYIGGYRRRPESAAWAKLGAAILARRLSSEKWEQADPAPP